MAKRKRRAATREKTASKRTKGRAQVKVTRTKAAKRAGRKTAAKKVAKRPAARTKAKKPATKARPKRAARKKTAPQSIERSILLAEAAEETVTVDIIEEPVPGVVVVTEFEAVKTTKPPEDDGGSD